MISRNRLFDGVVNASLVAKTFIQAGQITVDASGGTIILFPNQEVYIFLH